MITLQVKDSRKRVRTLMISGFLSQRGTKYAHITNDKGKLCHVRIKKNGQATCTCESRLECYHIKAVDSIDLMTVAQSGQVAANATFDIVAHAVEVVKSVSAAYGTCGHLVKPGFEGEVCGGCFQKMYM